MRRGFGFGIVVVAVVGIVVTWWLASRPAPTLQTAEFNDIAQTLAEHWPSIHEEDFARSPVPFLVIGEDGTPLFRRGDIPASTLQAAGAGSPSLPVLVSGRWVAQVYFPNIPAGDYAARQHLTAWAVTGAIAAVTLLATAHTWWLRRRVVLPFRRLERFAADVAAGDLDAPLQVDAGNVFGAWSESFDVMRRELTAARTQAAAAEESKRQLVAQISHDIRTPLASIRATAEVLGLKETDPSRLERLGVIDSKVAQLQSLVADLATAGTASRPSLEIRPEVVASSEIATWVSHAGSAYGVTVGPIPDCLIEVDPGRMQQVFDNILTNATKYARTAVTVTARLDADVLRIDVQDEGPGLPAAEVQAVFDHRFRGSNSAGIPGEGLGLHSCAQLMDAMGGSISASGDPGFRIRLGLPLAR